jgi:hypothetical protein
MKKRMIRPLLAILFFVGPLEVGTSKLAQAAPGAAQTLPKQFREMNAAERVGFDLIAKYQSDQAFNGVFIESPTTVRFAMKGDTASPVPTKIGSVSVTVQKTKFSFAELLEAAKQIDASNPSSYGTTIESDKDRLVVNLAATVDRRSDGSVVLDTSKVTPGIEVASVIAVTPPRLDAAEGGKLSTGNGCSTGFRYHGYLISSASHCPDNYGQVNGVTVNWAGDYCNIDNQIGTTAGNNTSTVIQGMPFTGGQGNVGAGTQLYKWGTATGWSYPTMGYFATSNSSCIGVAVAVLNGGTSAGGDSGGPIMTLTWNGSGYSYNAVGTNRGRYTNGNVMIIPMSSIHAAGFYVS